MCRGSRLDCGARRGRTSPPDFRQDGRAQPGTRGVPRRLPWARPVRVSRWRLGARWGQFLKAELTRACLSHPSSAARRTRVSLPDLGPPGLGDPRRSRKLPQSGTTKLDHAERRASLMPPPGGPSLRSGGQPEHLVSLRYRTSTPAQAPVPTDSCGRRGSRQAPGARREADQGEAPWAPGSPALASSERPHPAPWGPAHAPPGPSPSAAALGGEPGPRTPARARPPAAWHLGPRGPPPAGPPGEHAEGGGAGQGASGRLRPCRPLPPPWGRRVPCPCPAPPPDSRASRAPAARAAPPPPAPGRAARAGGGPSRKPRPRPHPARGHSPRTAGPDWLPAGAGVGPLSAGGRPPPVPRQRR